jgi:hypothetical protein
MAAIKDNHPQLFRIELMPSQLTPQLQLFQQNDISSVLQPIPSSTTSTGATSSIQLTTEDEELQQAVNNLGPFF